MKGHADGLSPWATRRGVSVVLVAALLWNSAIPEGQAQVFGGVAGAGQRVYELLPTFPIENQYLSRETGAVKANSTLVNRLIQYHVYAKRRYPTSRLDWKFTIADYLGFNEVMIESQYPGVAELKTSPFERDREILQKLSRTQRETLIETLMTALQPSVRNSGATKIEQTPAETQIPKRQIPALPKAGDAEQLRL